MGLPVLVIETSCNPRRNIREVFRALLPGVAARRHQFEDGHLLCMMILRQITNVHNSLFSHPKRESEKRGGCALA